MSVTQLNSYSAGDTNFTSMMETLDKTSKGKADITISNYDNDSAPVVKVGSVFENNGSLFIVDSADITPTGYSGISNSTTFYLYYDESAGTFIFSSTAPVWSDTLQGWYNGNDRAFFSMYKDSGGTLYENKEILKDTNYIKTTQFLSGSGVKHNDLFKALVPSLPNMGDKIALNGSSGSDSGTAAGALQVYTSATRYSSTVIRLDYIQFNIIFSLNQTMVAEQTQDITISDSTTYDTITISWSP